MTVLVPLIALSAIWGSSYLFIDIALRDFDPAFLACVRQLVAAACLLPLAASRGGLRGLSGHVRTVLMVALVMVGGPTLLVATGQRTVSSSLAGILVSTTPVFTVLIGTQVRSEHRPTAGQVAGVLIGLGGIVLLFGIDLQGNDMVLGGALLLLASLGYAIGGWIVKSRAGKIAPVGLAAASSALSGLFLLPIALTSLPTEAPNLQPVFALMELGVLGTAAGWVLYYWLIGRTGPRRASLAMYLAPVASVILGVLVADDPITWATIGGLALVVTGSWLASSGGTAEQEREREREPSPVNLLPNLPS